MKGTIEIQQKGITDLDVDAVVNAANSQLLSARSGEGEAKTRRNFSTAHTPSL